MTNIIAICNQKGGVGKTTTAVNLAASLAVAEKRTLLIDMDPQGNASSGVSINKHDVLLGLYEVLIGECALHDALHKTELSHLSALPANPNLVGAEIEMTGLVSRETLLQVALSKYLPDFDYIVIDCPPSLGLLTLNALTAANGIIVPVQCEYYALEGMADLMQTVDLVRSRLNPGLDLVGVLLTMFDGRNNLAKQVADELRQHFADKIFTSVIPRNVRLSEAPSHGRPVILYDIRSMGALRYLELAQEVIVRTQTTGNRPDERGATYAAAQGLGQGVVLADPGTPDTQSSRDRISH